MKDRGHLAGSTSLALLPLVAAGQAVQVADLNSAGAGSYPEHIVRVGSNTFFTATDAIHGRELWVLPDGESARLVKDIRPGKDSSYPSELVAFDSMLYFVAVTPEDGAELWRSDGTESGTVLLADLNPGPADSYPSALTPYGGTLYFAAEHPDTGRELWRLNGNTPALVADIEPGPGSSSPQGISVMPDGAGGSLLFFRAETSEAGAEPWISRGSSETTEMLDDLYPGIEGSNPVHAESLNDQWIFFSAYEGSRYQLYQYEPASSTLVAHDFSPAEDAFIESMVAFDGLLYFSASHPDYGSELWSYDGTSAGLTLIDHIPGPTGLSPRSLTAAGPTLFFVGTTADEGEELWYMQNAASGGQVGLARDIVSGPESSTPTGLTASGANLFFVAWDDEHGGEPWVANGFEPTSVSLLKDIHPLSTRSSIDYLPFVAHPTGVFFAADDSAHGVELWDSDGTETGTRLAADANTDTSDGNAWGLFEFKGEVYGTVATSKYGLELHAIKDDGTIRLVKDIFPGPEDSLPSRFLIAGDHFYFSASNDEHGAELWRSDGTEAGTHLVKDIVPGQASSRSVPLAALADGRVLFAARDGDFTHELWITDGTDAGTQLLADVGLGGENSCAFCAVELDGVHYFVATDGPGGSYGRSLWKTDGTTDGTTIAVDVTPGFDSADIAELTAANGALYFAFVDEAGDWALYRSDGTPAGTELVIDPTPSSAGRLSDLTWVPELERLVFQAWSEEEGTSLWISDGTAAGSYPLPGVHPGGEGTHPSFVAYDGALYFVGNDGVHGYELWRYELDGTPEIVLDAAPGTAGTSLHEIVPFDGKLYLALSDGTEIELWQSDGTADGTVLFQDINPREGQGSYPSGFFVKGEILLFVANGGEPGYELWTLGGPPPGDGGDPPDDGEDPGDDDGTGGGDPGDGGGDPGDGGGDDGGSDGGDGGGDDDGGAPPGDGGGQPNPPPASGGSSGGSGSFDLLALAGLAAIGLWRRRRATIVNDEKSPRG